MKENYKIGDKVIATKPPYINQLPGTVLSNDPDKTDNNVCVILDGQLGTFYLNYSQVEPIEKEKNKPLNAMEYNYGMYESEIKGLPNVKTKRPYHKKSK